MVFSVTIHSTYLTYIYIFLKEQMNFSLIFTKPPDNAWGSLRSDGTWSGIVRQLQDGTVDIG